MDKFGLPERTVNEILSYFKQNEQVLRVYIYGSRAKGTYRNGSDIDFAIEGTPDFDSSLVGGDLNDLPTPYIFDVTDLSLLSHEGMLTSIKKDGVLFYERP